LHLQFLFMSNSLVVNKRWRLAYEYTEEAESREAQEDRGRAYGGRVGDHAGGLGERAVCGRRRAGGAGRHAGLVLRTVKLTMDRMVAKGFLQIERIRNLQLFRSCISEVEARRGELRKMLGRAFGGALPPMLKFLIEHEGLSKEEAAELRELVKKAGKGED